MRRRIGAFSLCKQMIYSMVVKMFLCCFFGRTIESHLEHRCRAGPAQYGRLGNRHGPAG